jgi:hypothetical protein
MSKGVVIMIVALLLVGFAVAIPGCMYVTYNNQEVRLRKKAEAQQKANETSFDTCWKVVSQIAQVADQYKEAFKEIYPKLMEGRYGNARGGALMSWVTESNPQFDTKLYEKVANAIEEHRLVFKRDQQKLIDIKREHDVLLETIPSSIFVGGRDAIEIQIVTSSKTEKTFTSGKEDDVDLFGKKGD